MVGGRRIRCLTSRLRKCDENGRKLSKRVENTVGKEKLPVTSDFSFFHSVFKRLIFQGRQKGSLCVNGLRSVGCRAYGGLGDGSHNSTNVYQQFDLAGIGQVTSIWKEHASFGLC